MSICTCQFIDIYLYMSICTCHVLTCLHIDMSPYDIYLWNIYLWYVSMYMSICTCQFIDTYLYMWYISLYTSMCICQFYHSVSRGIGASNLGIQREVETLVNTPPVSWCTIYSHKRVTTKSRTSHERVTNQSCMSHEWVTSERVNEFVDGHKESRYQTKVKTLVNAPPVTNESRMSLERMVWGGYGE